MPRPPRNFYPGGSFHVMSRGNRKKEIFHDASDYRMFLSLLRSLKTDMGILIFHYMLMPNHFHHALSPSDDQGSKFMQMLKGKYGMYYATKYKTIGHVWQGRFKSEHIDSDSYLLACGNYIEMNPVRAGLVDRPEDWPYSSYHYYAYGVEDPIVTTSPLYQALGRTEKERKENYREQLNKTRSF